MVGPPMQMTICYVYATFTKFGEFYLWDSVQQNIEKKMKKVLFGHYQALISFLQRALLPPYTHTPFSALYRALKARSKKKNHIESPHILPYYHTYKVLTRSVFLPKWLHFQL